MLRIEVGIEDGDGVEEEEEVIAVVIVEVITGTRITISDKMEMLALQDLIEDGNFISRQKVKIDLFTDLRSYCGTYYSFSLKIIVEYKENSPTVEKVKNMESFIKRNKVFYSLTEIEERRSYSLDLKRLLAEEELIVQWPTFKDDLSENPEHTLNCLGLAMHQVIAQSLDGEILADLPDTEKETFAPVDLPTIRARIINFEPVIQLKHLKTNLYGKLISVRGTIIRAGNIKLLCDWLAFSCNSCQNVQCVKQPEGIYTQPTKCRTGGCRSKSFTPQRSSLLTLTVNWQSVRLQEIVADDQREGGRVPRTIECELTEDLVDSCVPGDVVTITGVVKEIHAQPQLFRLLVASLCPAIYSHEMVKAGLLLGLLGGSATPMNNMAPSAMTASLDTRSDPHILVVGDPGLGKSQMLQACASVAPRGVYVCGNTSTASGLTVTLTRESGSDYALEAGALVLADQGCCCIDEFDKMSSQHQVSAIASSKGEVTALLEAMEQQCISVAKAGVLCTLPARTSILAAANPVGGHYNRSKTVSENLKLGSALLSRFDLVFILLDQPNEAPTNH
ncbi:hypothetical protein J437_LFUL007817 [Ladona fulva]|uniref:DNA helicase MCM8 n=1 Tax=Ladona fulva TaxID=123851 RepID=A0A8K0K6I7_LADFU|nr:hypothetical protein J437_LFUL007817 [Ladona fulva]